MPRAGLDAAAVTEAAADLADEVGLSQLSMGLLADRLGVKTPSLYKHVDGLGDLRHRVAVLASNELGQALAEATAGRKNADALNAVARTVRAYVVAHPGRYAATDGERPTGPDDSYIAATDVVLAHFSSALRGYSLKPAQERHALRMLRSVLHGFSTLEAAGGFQYGTSIDASFTWVIEFLDHGLRTSATASR